MPAQHRLLNWTEMGESGTRTFCVAVILERSTTKAATVLLSIGLKNARSEVYSSVTNGTLMVFFLGAPAGTGKTRRESAAGDGGCDVSLHFFGVFTCTYKADPGSG